MSDIPTLREEVNRKAFETLDKIVSDYNLGKITKAQYKYGFDIAWSLVSGLITPELVAMFGALGDEVRAISSSEKTVFRNPETQTNLVLIDSKTGLIVFKLIQKGEKDKVNMFDKRDEPNPYLAGKQKVEAIIEGLKAKGFVEL